MIKENELRLNNLVTDEWYDSFKTIIKVDSINEKGINLEIIDDGNWAEIAQRWIKPEYEFNSIFPIPLTEEWLIKFGFRKYNLEGYSVHFRYEHPKLHSTVTAIYNSDFSIKLDNVARGIKYVHQLQNIYTALTNKELELIKE